jgi:LysR family positive regulator for ilvC
MDQWSQRIFLSLAESLHFGRTGRECNVSPSAVSRTIQRLEEEVGEPLFLRDRRSVALTPVGEQFRRFARDSLQRWEDFRAGRAAEQGTLRGELALYCSVAASYTVLAPLMARFRECHPEVHIRLQTGDPARAVSLLAEGGADISVAARPERLAANVAFKTITVTPLAFIAPTVPCEAARLCARQPIAWARVPLILSETGLSRRRAEAWLRSRGVRPRVYAEVSGHEAVVSMVRLGCGVGVVPEVVRERFAGADEVRALEVSPPLEPYIIGLCAHRRRLTSPVVQAFWNLVDG